MAPKASSEIVPRHCTASTYNTRYLLTGALSKASSQSQVASQSQFRFWAIAYNVLKMFSSKALLFLLAFLQGSPFVASEGHEHEELCTHGLLYIADVNSTNLRAFDLDGDSLADLAVQSTIQVPGGNGQVLQVTGSHNVASIYRGTEASYWADGRVNFLSTGLSQEEHGDHLDLVKDGSSIIQNAGFDCARPIHFVNHDSKVAIFCDGSFDALPAQINSTVWVVDETLIGTSAASAIVFTDTLQGTHHGVVIPVDDDHLLYSLALPGRINREEGVSSLPATFQVVDFDGSIMHSISDTSDPDTHCTGFHGSSAIENTFALACDASHGGIVVVEYDDVTSTYASRALSYPLEGHRTGTFAEHDKSAHVVGNFAGESNEFHLLAFDPTAAAVGEPHIQTLDVGQCEFAFEKAHGEHLLVWLPSGMLQVYSVDPIWSLVAEVQVIDNMSACSEAELVVGYNQAFIIANDPGMVYAVDLTHVDHDESVPIATTTLGFNPSSAVVAGLACVEDHDDHDDHEGDGDHNGSSASLIGMVTTTILSVGAFVMM